LCISYFSNYQNFASIIKLCFLDRISTLEFKNGIADDVDLTRLIELNSNNIALNMFFWKGIYELINNFHLPRKIIDKLFSDCVEIIDYYTFLLKYSLLKNVIFEELFSYGLTPTEREHDLVVR
jgi:hypothetical protein